MCFASNYRAYCRIRTCKSNSKPAGRTCCKRLISITNSHCTECCEGDCLSSRCRDGGHDVVVEDRRAVGGRHLDDEEVAGGDGGGPVVGGVGGEAGGGRPGCILDDLGGGAGVVLVEQGDVASGVGRVGALDGGECHAAGNDGCQCGIGRSQGRDGGALDGGGGLQCRIDARRDGGHDVVVEDRRAVGGRHLDDEEVAGGDGGGPVVGGVGGEAGGGRPGCILDDLGGGAGVVLVEQGDVASGVGRVGALDGGECHAAGNDGCQCGIGRSQGRDGGALDGGGGLQCRIDARRDGGHDVVVEDRRAVGGRHLDDEEVAGGDGGGPVVGGVGGEAGGGRPGCILDDLVDSGSWIILSERGDEASGVGRVGRRSSRHSIAASDHGRQGGVGRSQAYDGETFYSGGGFQSRISCCIGGRSRERYETQTCSQYNNNNLLNALREEFQSAGRCIAAHLSTP